MKVDIDAEGVLVVTPETGLEAFALNAWFDELERRVTWKQMNDSKGGIVIKPVAKGEKP